MSGTPPRNLLYTDPVTYDRSSAKTKIWETNRDLAPDAPFDVKAFHWGSLTSGSKITAFWILLSPFMFANVAGWMADGKKWAQAFVRLTGLSLTALFVAQLAVVLIDLTTQTLAGSVGRGPAAGGGGAVLGLIFIGMVWGLSTRSSIRRLSVRQQFRLLFGLSRDSLLPPDPEQPWTAESEAAQFADPAVGATLSDSAMWERHSILHRLRRLHLGVGLLLIVVVLEWGLDERGFTAWIGLGLIAIAGMATLGESSAGSLVLMVTRFVVPVAVLAWIASVVHVTVSAGNATAQWPNIHLVVFYSALGMGSSMVLAMVGQFLSKRPGDRSNSLLPAGAFAIAGLVGGAMGVAAALIAESAIYRWAPNNPFQTSADSFDIGAAQVMVNGGGWIAVAMLIFLLGFVALASLAAIGSPSDYPLPSIDDGRAMAMLRMVTCKASWVFGGAGILAAVLGGLAILNGCSLPIDCDPVRLDVFDSRQLLPIAMTAIASVSIILLAIAVSRVSLGSGVAVLAVGGAITWAVLDTRFDELSFTVPLIGLTVSPTVLVDISVLVMILGVAYLILRSIIGGIGSPDSRRRVGMLWDTGSFWPRWFHPLGPPAYGPAAVRSLRNVLADPLRRPQLLTAHSQGSVIATVALSDVIGTELPLGYLTYGNPLGILYSELFPSVDVEGLISEVDARWGQRKHWVNLWRNTDPLGGEELPGMMNDRLVVTGTGHSQYELTPEFWIAREDSISGLA
jgi:hypothetical protein